MFKPTRTVPWIVVVALSLGACASYVPRAASIERAQAVLPEAPSGPLGFEQAVRLLVTRHPALKALQAEILAVNLRPGPEFVGGSMEIMDGRAGETLLEAEVFSLLGIGPRGGRRALAHAIANERVRELQERARALVGQLAEAYAVERVYGALESPVPQLDLEAYERAGLIPGAALSAGQAALAEAQAELAVVSTRQREARRQISELVGARPGVEFEPGDVGPSWPPVLQGDAQQLLLARGDLQSAYAAYLVADRGFRLAVDEQWPGLMVGVGGNIDLSMPMQMVRIRLPAGAAYEAQAREQAREAAWMRLQDRVQAALHQAAAAQLELEEAQAMLAGAVQSRQAARALIQAEAERARTDPDAFVGLVMAAGQEVEAARRVREALSQEARARVRAARAAGWPSQRWMEENR